MTREACLHRWLTRIIIENRGRREEDDDERQRLARNASRDTHRGGRERSRRVFPNYGNSADEGGVKGQTTRPFRERTRAPVMPRIGAAR